MDKTEARTLFKEADRLFKSGDYVEALQHLAELNEKYPNSFNVLYPILLCREKLGRTKEAITLCNQMMDRFTSSKEREKLCKAYQRLSQAQSVSAPAKHADNLPGNEFIKDEPYRIEIDPSGIAEIAGRWVHWKNLLIAVGVAIGVFVVLAALPFLLPKNEEGVVAGANVILFVLSLLMQYILNCVVFYLALWVNNKLLHEELALDILDVCIMAPLYAIALCMPIVGWIAAYLIVAPRYSMNFFEYISFLLLLLLFNIVFVYMFLLPFFGEAVVEYL